MNRPFRRPGWGATVSTACFCMGLAAAPARADIGDLLDVEAPGHWRLVGAPYTKHLHDKPEYRYVWGVGIERQRDDLWLYGATYFSNSFGQDSGYVYFGRQYAELFDVPPLYFQWTVGLLYGYRGEFRNRVPLNYDGFSPGAVLSIGWHFDERFSAQINKVGTSGAMIQLSYDFP